MGKVDLNRNMKNEAKIQFATEIKVYLFSYTSNVSRPSSGLIIRLKWETNYIETISQNSKPEQIWEYKTSIENQPKLKRCIKKGNLPKGNLVTTDCRQTERDSVQKTSKINSKKEVNICKNICQRAR